MSHVACGVYVSDRAVVAAGCQYQYRAVSIVLSVSAVSIVRFSYSPSACHGYSVRPCGGRASPVARLPPAPAPPKLGPLRALIHVTTGGGASPFRRVHVCHTTFTPGLRPGVVPGFQGPAQESIILRRIHIFHACADPLFPSPAPHQKEGCNASSSRCAVITSCGCSWTCSTG